MRVVISEIMAAVGGRCPVCKRIYKPNGVGGSGSILTPILDKLPSSHLLRYAANFHDWAYHLGENFGTQKEADLLMLQKGKDIIAKKCKWYEKPFYHAMNYRNYYAVRIFGSKFWDKDNCRPKLSFRI